MFPDAHAIEFLLNKETEMFIIYYDIIIMITTCKPWSEQTVNWLILSFDILFALVATVLGILGLGTFKTIKHLGIGKSFWVPVFISGIFFLLGSAVRIFHEFAVEYGWSLTIYTDEIVRVSWLLALGILLGSIYNYSRKVKKAIRVQSPDAHSVAELTLMQKETNELLKRIEKLKNKYKK